MRFTFWGIVIIVIAYVVGAKYPQLAQRVGIA
jgi:hypothetical protein